MRPMEIVFAPSSSSILSDRPSEAPGEAGCGRPRARVRTGALTWGAALPAGAGRRRALPAAGGPRAAAPRRTPSRALAPPARPGRIPGDPTPRRPARPCAHPHLAPHPPRARAPHPRPRRGRARASRAARAAPAEPRALTWRPRRAACAAREPRSLGRRRRRRFRVGRPHVSVQVCERRPPRRQQLRPRRGPGEKSL